MKHLTYIKYWLLGVLLSISLSGGVVFAHGGEDTSAETRHPETQIGLPGSKMGHDDMEATTSGMTREEVAALIHDTQSTEEKRSAIKLTVLTLAIVGLIYLYFPRKSVVVPTASVTQSLSMPQIPPSTPTAAPIENAHEHSP